jgi:pimeloyl-ACP methyl ester carboxylesterase
MRGYPHPMTTDRKTITTPDGTTISYLTKGDGPALLLLHGFMSSAKSWWNIGAAQRLAETHTIIAPDIRGHGQSGRPTDPALYGRQLLADFVQLMDHEGHSPAGVIGFSMGAELALALAAFHPDRVSSLTLAGSGWSPPEIIDEYRKWYDALATSSDNPEALRALIEGVPDFTGLPHDVIAALPMQVNGIIGALDDERPYMERIAEARPAFKPVILPDLDHLGTWKSQALVDFLVRVATKSA